MGVPAVSLLNARPQNCSLLVGGFLRVSLAKKRPMKMTRFSLFVSVFCVGGFHKLTLSLIICMCCWHLSLHSINNIKRFTISSPILSSCCHVWQRCSICGRHGSKAQQACSFFAFFAQKSQDRLGCIVACVNHGVRHEWGPVFRKEDPKLFPEPDR
jgi:hypothetical protein